VGRPIGICHQQERSVFYNQLVVSLRTMPAVIGSSFIHPESTARLLLGFGEQIIIRSRMILKRPAIHSVVCEKIKGLK
jgi:hypothetical protein